jgi:hypothetical protein
MGNGVFRVDIQTCVAANAKGVLTISNLSSSIWLIEQMEMEAKHSLIAGIAGIASLILPPLVRLGKCF